MVTIRTRVGLDSQMHGLHVPVEVRCQVGLVIAQLARESRLDPHVNHFAVPFQIPRIVGLVVALITVKPLHSLMHSFLVVVQKVFMNSLVVT